MVLLTIPKHTTSLIQPPDVYGFRIWKQFVRRFSDQVLIDDLDVNLHQRNSIIKLQSLVHNQFSSPRFVDMFKYAWFKCGYVENRPPRFKNPVEFCFANNGSECHYCDSFNFIVCGWCQKSLCLLIVILITITVIIILHKMLPKICKIGSMLSEISYHKS